MRITTKLAVLTAPALMIASVPAHAAALVSYELNGQPGNEASVAATGASAGITGTALTRSASLNAVTGGNSLNSSGFASADGYLTFGFSVLSGFTATVTDLSFASQASNTGPGTINVLASIDGAAFASVATFTQAASQQNDTVQFSSPLSALSSLVFRLAAATGTAAANPGSTFGSGGTFRVEDYGTTSTGTTGVGSAPFTINGSVTAIGGTTPTSPVPEPASWAMLMLGFGLVGAAMRSRGRSVKVAFA